MWQIVGYGGLTLLAAATLALYAWRWPVSWVRVGITVFFLAWFGSKAWNAWQARQRDRAELRQYLRRQGILLLVLALAMGLAVAVSPVVAMSCTTQTYYVDGRYVMCQTCCTWGNCMTTCF